MCENEGPNKAIYGPFFIITVIIALNMLNVKCAGVQKTEKR